MSSQYNESTLMETGKFLHKLYGPPYIRQVRCQRQQCTPLSYVDFLPQMLEAPRVATRFKTRELIGPNFEELEVLVKRANGWIVENAGSKLVSCETVEYEIGIPADRQDENENNKQHAHAQCRACLRTLRLWVCDRDHSSPYTHQQLDYLNVVPSRLEVDPAQLVPKFENFTKTMERFKRHIKEEGIPGELVSMETQELKLTHEDCQTDPDRLFWMRTEDTDTYFLSFLRVFFIRGSPREVDIGFKDFFPKCVKCNKNEIAKLEPCDALMERTCAWLQEHTHTTLTNIQTINHKLYDYSGAEVEDDGRMPSTTRSLFVHFTDKPIHNVKFIRAYYMRSSAEEPGDAEEAGAGSPTADIRYRTFVTSCVDSATDTAQWATLGERSEEAVIDASDWLLTSGAKLVGAETIQIPFPLGKKKPCPEDTHTLSAGYYGQKHVYAFRVFFTGGVEVKKHRRSSKLGQPVKSNSSNCAIL